MGFVLDNLGFVCALGCNRDDIIKNARAGNTDGMFSHLSNVGENNVPYGTAPVESKSDVRFQDLILAAFNQISADVEKLKTQFDTHRLGIVIGASNTAVHEAMHQIVDFMANGKMSEKFTTSELELGYPAEFLCAVSGFAGPCYTISTACSSGIKAFAAARSLIENDVCDAVLVGGVDGRCDFALNGFWALESLSANHTNPMSENRDGINLGECAALFIMQRGNEGISILGIGESSDAYHPTAPDPTGGGAIASMCAALSDANLTPDDIDYINMHGTGTVANDAMESHAIYNVFGNKTPCASTKPLTGHCLGAAGACSVAIAWLMIKYGFSVPHVYDGKFASDCAPINLMTSGANCEINTVMCNAFAFGGSNATIIIGQKNG